MSNKTIQLLIGADPELFCRNPNSNEFVSVHDMLPGTKSDPYKVDFGAIQVDGTAAEFNIDPASNVDEFTRNIAKVMESLGDRLIGYELVAQPSVYYEPSYFLSIPDHAKELGCDPDYNAWNQGAVNPRPNASTNMRTGSGHVHVGWKNGANPFEAEHFNECLELIQLMDYYVGLPSLLWDDDDTRRTLYGKAGAFRPKSYGVEYRVLSNAWLRSPLLQRWVYQSTTTAFNKFIERDFSVLDEFGDLAQKIINSGDSNWAELRPELAQLVPTPPKALFRKAA